MASVGIFAMDKIIYLTALLSITSGVVVAFDIPGFSSGSEDTHASVTQDLKAHLPEGITTTSVEHMDRIDPKHVEGLKIGDGREYEANGEVSCGSFLKKMIIKALPAFNSCMKEMQLTIGKLKRNLRGYLPCMVKCIGIKMKILTEDGMFNVEYARTFIMETIPPRLMDFVWQIWEECAPYVAELDATDPTCNSYRPIMKCAMESAFKIAAEVLKRCPDIAPGMKGMAMGFTNSNAFRNTVHKYVDP